tara:strand:+ start:396 stop:716 length:321 start_codon:yes stop_codon:yes gene_type:complete
MTLRVDLRNCKKSKTTATINSFELGCLSMVVQMGQITEDTYQEFYARCKVYWTMSGSEDWYTLDQIRDLIGADINTAYATQTKFLNHQFKNMLSDLKESEKKLEVA